MPPKSTVVLTEGFFGILSCRFRNRRWRL